MNVASHTTTHSATHEADSGATIIEALIAMTLLFIALTAALYAQSHLSGSLGTCDLLRVTTLTDSLVVTLAADSSYTDSTFQLELDSGKYIAHVAVRTSEGLRNIRITTNRRAHNKPLHTVYYEQQYSQESE